MLMKSEPARSAVMGFVVEDEVADVVKAYLAKAGYATASARSGPDAVHIAQILAPDVVILDLGLPGLDGVEVVRRIRDFSDCYMLITTTRTEEVDRLVGLSAGADDYLTKPFSVRELVARVQTVLRRPRSESEAPDLPTARTFGELEIDTTAHEVRLAGHPAPLTPTEPADDLGTPARSGLNSPPTYGGRLGRPLCPSGRTEVLKRCEK